MSLVYFMNTYYYICIAVKTLKQLAVGLMQIHWTVEKHMLRYLKGIVHCSLKHVGNGDLMLHGFWIITRKLVIEIGRVGNLSDGVGEL